MVNVNSRTWFCFSLQDERNQIMTTNVWLAQVKQQKYNYRPIWFSFLWFGVFVQHFLCCAIPLVAFTPPFSQSRKRFCAFCSILFVASRLRGNVVCDLASNKGISKTSHKSYQVWSTHLDPSFLRREDFSFFLGHQSMDSRGASPTSGSAAHSEMFLSIG